MSRTGARVCVCVRASKTLRTYTTHTQNTPRTDGEGGLGDVCGHHTLPCACFFGVVRACVLDTVHYTTPTPFMFVCERELIMDPVLDVCVRELIMDPVLDVCV